MQEGNKKVPLPAAVHLKQAVGALTLHTGRNYMLYYGHKNARSKYGEPSRLFQMYSSAKMGIKIVIAKKVKKNHIGYDIIFVSQNHVITEMICF